MFHIYFISSFKDSRRDWYGHQQPGKGSHAFKNENIENGKKMVPLKNATHEKKERTIKIWKRLLIKYHWTKIVEIIYL